MSYIAVRDTHHSHMTSMSE